jgi:hypothetical protein
MPNESKPATSHPIVTDLEHISSPVNRNNTENSGFKDFADFKENSMSESVVSDRELI